MTKQLTPKQARFVEEYMIDLNATQAAIRAGYSAKRASEIGYQLLQKTTVQETVTDAQMARSERTRITADQVLEELAIVGFSNIGDYVKWEQDELTLTKSEDLTERQLAAVAEVSRRPGEHGDTIRFKLHNKLAALVSMGRHLGMFVDKQEHSVDPRLVDFLDSLNGTHLVPRGG